MAHGVLAAACGIWFLDQGSNQGPLHWECRILPLVTREVLRGSFFNIRLRLTPGFPGGRVIKNLPANAGDARDSGLMPGSGRYPEAEICNPLQYPCLENPMDRETSQAAVHGIARSPARLSVHTYIHTASHPGPVSVSEPCCVFLVSRHMISLPLSR